MFWQEAKSQCPIIDHTFESGLAVKKSQQHISEMSKQTLTQEV